MDIDGDGDLDLPVADNSGDFAYFEKTADGFEKRDGAADDPFDGTAVGSGARTAFIDLDGDGDLDLAAGLTDGTIASFENTGTAQAAAWTARTGAANPFDGIDVGNNAAPAFVDLGGDGDFDLVVGNATGVVLCFENTGTAQAPAWTPRTGAANPFDGIDVGDLSAPVFANLDGRTGPDLHMVVATRDGAFQLFSNTGTPQAPSYAAVFSNRLGVIDLGDGNSPQAAFGDVDGDGDPDLVTGHTMSHLLLYLNTDGSFQAEDRINPFHGVNEGWFTAAGLADLDGNGLPDLAAGSYGGQISRYSNLGTTAEPDYREQTGTGNPWNGFDVGYYAIPDFADLDGDGDMDLAVGAYSYIDYYENTGSAGAPAYTRRTGSANPFSTVTLTSQYAHPTLVDHDDDGDFDLAVGGWSGTDGFLRYFENTGTAQAPAWTERTGTANPFDGITASLGRWFSMISTGFIDIDGNGSPEMFAGLSDGTIRLYEDDGTGYQERTGADNPLDDAGIGVWVIKIKPVDADDDGDMDLVISARTSEATPLYAENLGDGTFVIFQ